MGSELLQMISEVHTKLVGIENNVAKLISRMDKLESRIEKMEEIPDVVVEKVIPKIAEVLNVV